MKQSRRKHAGQCCIMARRDAIATSRGWLLFFITVCLGSLGSHLHTPANAWNPILLDSCSSSTSLQSAMMSPVVSRRFALTQTRTLLIGTTAATTLAPPAQAKNLPDRPSVDTSRSGTAETLAPVREVYDSLRRIRATIEKDATSVLLRSSSSSSSSSASITAVSPFSSSAATTLWTIPTQQRAFEAIFDAYSDPVSYQQRFVDQNAFLVYYSKGFDGPGRPNIESSLPVRQTLQYGARNDAWVGWHEFVEELEYQQQSQSASNEKMDETSLQDLQKPLEAAIRAVESYLAVSGQDL